MSLPYLKISFMILAVSKFIERIGLYFFNKALERGR